MGLWDKRLKISWVNPKLAFNNVIEQDHRFSKRRIRYSQWLQTFETAEATIAGYQSIHMTRKAKSKAWERKISWLKKYLKEDELLTYSIADKLFGIAA